MHKVILILDKFFLKYVGGTGWGVKLTPLEKTILKKASLIRVNTFTFIYMLRNNYVNLNITTKPINCNNSF